MDHFVGERAPGLLAQRTGFDHGDADAPIKLADGPFGGIDRLVIIAWGLGDSGKPFGGAATEFVGDSGIFTIQQGEVVLSET